MGGLPQTQDFFRFFPRTWDGPRMGGLGRTRSMRSVLLERWVEHGAAPDSIPASHSANGLVDRARPLCPYPQVAVYSGLGDINDAHNFSCGRR
jgi:feruloyl esterase